MAGAVAMIGGTHWYFPTSSNAAKVIDLLGKAEPVKFDRRGSKYIWRYMSAEEVDSLFRVEMELVRGKPEKAQLALPSPLPYDV